MKIKWTLLSLALLGVMALGLMPGMGMGVLAANADNLVDLSLNGDVYTINTAEGWNQFCDMLADNKKGFFTGKTVKLGTDIGTKDAPITRMAGGTAHDFTGTFDGGGHTLTVKYGSADSPIATEGAAPFVSVENGCRIENLHISGDIYSSAKFAGGILGNQFGAVAIRNCRVSAVIHSYTAGDGTHGGIVGLNYNTSGSSLIIKGCLFDGKLLTEGTTASNSCSGFVGFRAGALSIADSLYAPAATGAEEQEISDGSATFARNAAVNSITNCYYTRALGDKQGTAARSVTAGDDYVNIQAVSPIGEAKDTYDVSGITAYAKGIACSGTFYFGNGDNVSLTLGHGEVPEGFTFGGYKADAGILAGSDNPYTLTMLDQNVSVSAIILNPADISVDGDIYTIKTATGWDVFCDLLAYNTKGFFTGKTVKLGADIGTEANPINRMAGGNGHDFTGAFDGGGHTLTVKYGSADSPNGFNYTAPFAYVENGCTIANLRVNGDIYTSHMYAGGLVGLQWGTVAIRNCHVSVVIHCYTTSGDPCEGGIIGRNAATLTVEGCLFDGRLLSEGEKDSTSCAGFVGWQDENASLSFNDCLYAPAPINAGEREISQSCCTFVRKKNNKVPTSITNCYYTRPLGTAQGKAAHSVTAGEYVTVSVVALTGGATPYSVSGITAYSGGGLSHGGNLYYGNGDVISLTLDHAEAQEGFAFVGYAVDAGALAGSDNPYTLTMPDQDVVVSAIILNSADISVDVDEYTIKTTEGWDAFCDLLANNAKGYFTGKTVKLGANITVTRMAGGDNHDFCGTFDGQAHTLTFNCGSADSPVSEQYIAPFRYVSNVDTAAATIQNLRVAGDIYTSAKYAAGFIGRLWGTVNIVNCRSSVVIHSSVDGDGTHGGFVPENNSAPLNITGCVFDGKLLTTGSTTSCGGFVGFGGNETQVFISNSLYAPAAIGAGETEVLASGSATFNRTGATLANSYYTRPLGDKQGTAARSVTGAEGVTVAVSPVGEPTGEYDVSGITVYAKGIVWNGTFYYGNGDEVSLTLGHGDAPEGYTYNGYTVNAGALAGSGNPYTLTMPDRDVTVTAFLPIVPYLDWDEASRTLVEKKGEDALKYYTVVYDTTTVWENGWYVVDRDVQIDDRIEVKGTVNLILCDDATLTAKAGITVEGSNSLTVFAQSTGDKKGTLYAGTTDGADNTCAASCAGIGSASEHAGEITINGGAIIARGGGSGIRGAGIGGNRYNNCGAITINSGSVNATGSKYAAGIGNGPDVESTGGKVTVNGGVVQASSVGDGAGIGGGTNGASPNIEITGGTVEASSADWGAGIGGGYYSGDTYFADPGSVTISGGTIRATGGANGPGIGCMAGGAGKRCSYSGITITGGDITATGGDHGAGIGCGQNGDLIKIEIGGSGTVIHAQGGAQASGIGGGFRSNNTASSPKGQIIIAGGGITANGGNAGAGIGGGYENGNSSSNGISVSISGGTINATGGENGAGIGCGDYDSAIATNSPGVDIGITGGDITATGGMRSAGIGQSRNVKGGKVTISGESTMVTAHGGNWAAGIGGGNYSACESITIDGGTVNADSPGTGYGAGIGGGGHTSGGTITINGGTIHAGSARYGAGIGGGGDNGNNSDGGTTIVIIHGGEVTATGSRGNDDGTYYGAGIGGGGSKVSTGSVTVTIDGGTVVATGAAGGPGIGAGYGGVPTTVALGWTPDAQGKAPALPSVTADRYAGTVKIEKNFKYMNGDGKVPVMITDALDDPDAIANRTLTPANLNAITVTAAEHGSVQASASVQFEGDDVTLTVIPEAGYRLESISATDANGGDVALTGTGDTRGFTMPDKAVTVTSAFGLIPPTITVQPASKELVYGYEDGGALAVEATCHEALTPGWQWYSCDGNGENGVPIDTAAEPTAATSSYRIPAGKNAGTYTYYCVVTASLNGQTATAASGLATVTVAPAGSASAAVTANNRPYDGTEQALVTVDDSTLVGGRMNYALGANATTAPEDTAYGESIPRAANAGTYYVWYKVVGDDNHNDTEPVCVSVKIDKANATAATVTANNRAYDGTEQTLVTVSGEPTGGEMQYALGDANGATQPYTTSIPTATAAGTYYVWYMVKGDEEHQDFVAETPVKVSIDGSAIVAHSLVLSGSIGVRFYVEFPESELVDRSSCYMTFKLYNEENVQKMTFSEAEKASVDIDGVTKELYVFDCYVNAVQMADEITAELHYKIINSEGKLVDAEEPVTENYSARDYIKSFRKVAGQYDKKTQNLVKALGEYGYYSQLYLSELRGWTLGTAEEDKDHVAMDNYGYTPKTYSAAERTAAAEDLADNIVQVSLSSRIQKVTYSLILESETKICLYFEPKSGYTGGASATVDGMPVSRVTKSSGRFVVEIPNIAAHRLGKTYNVQLTTNGVTTTVNVSALSYVYSKLSSSKDAKEINAMMALYNYSKAADALLA